MLDCPKDLGRSFSSARINEVTGFLKNKKCVNIYIQQSQRIKQNVVKKGIARSLKRKNILKKGAAVNHSNDFCSLT